MRLARRGRTFAAPGVVLQTGPGPGGPGVRVGFTASRKVGNAVRRNRARRRLRALAEEVLPGLAAAGRDYVLIARRATIDRPWPALRGDLETALKRTRARAGAAR